MGANDNLITVTKRDTLDVGSVIGVKANNFDVALYNIDGEIFATHNICTHAHALLSDSWLDGDIIKCPSGRFKAKTGKGPGAPIGCDVKTLPVRIQGNAVQVNVA